MTGVRGTVIEELRGVSTWDFPLLAVLMLQVDSEVCEQTFSWLSRYARISKHMNRAHFMFYILKGAQYFCC